MVSTSLKRSLFLTTKAPYPPIGGAALRNWQNINSLMKLSSIGICYIHIDNGSTFNQPEKPPEVTWFSTHIVERRQIWTKIRYSLCMTIWLLTQIPPLTDLHYAPKVAQELDQIMQEIQPDVVILEELWVYCYLHIFKRYSCKIIYDAHNFETLLYNQIFESDCSISLKERVRRWLRLIFVRKAECRIIQEADQVWVCSNQDAALIQALGRDQVKPVLVSNCINTSYYESVRSGQCQLPQKLKPHPHTIIFAASFGYSPNMVAAHWLIEKIYPALQERYPDCRLFLVGAEPTEQMEVAALHQPNIIVAGKVPDIRPYLAASSVVVTPLLQGSGTRLKILEAFAAGRPVVSTTKGVEGLSAQNGVHLLIGDSAESLVEGICKLWEEPELHQKISETAYHLVQSMYSWEAAEQQTVKALNNLFENTSYFSKV
jgi:glycosyltransferase involved in cell wall biosynthesis